MAAAIGNKYSEKWTEEILYPLLPKMIELLESENKLVTEDSFKIRVEKEFGIPYGTYNYLFDIKFKENEVLRDYKDKTAAILEQRVMLCKDMYPAIAVMTLKNKHKWKDRSETDVTTKGEAFNGFNFLPPITKIE